MEPNTHNSKDDQLKFEFFCRIEEEEYKAITWYNRKLGYRSTIQTTQYLFSNVNTPVEFPTITSFRSNQSSKVIPIIIILGICPPALAYDFWVSGKPFTDYLPGIIIYLVMLISFIISIKRKTLNYSISFTREKIEVNGETYRWPEILETYIVRRPEGNKGTFFFVIGLRSGELLRYNLEKFRGLFSNSIVDKLVKATEYYKVIL